jgi:uncharacterized protein (DUF2062 family)/2-polyprenyl-3-methyl-5-hydroxy-6-metoxy-1,4-benzoquinol methylase
MRTSLHRFLEPARRISTLILTERLRPEQAAAAVFTGVFIGIVPIYGFQSLAALGLAVLFGLNKPLTLAATFINNPFLQPGLVVASIGLGRLMLTGRFGVVVSRAEIWNSLRFWFAGSVPLGLAVGGLMAAAAFAAAGWRSPGRRTKRARARAVRTLYAGAPWFDRGFVRWKLRLDRIFDYLEDYLEDEDTAAGALIDLGCGHGIASAFLASKARRRIYACDLDSHRIAIAREAFRDLDASFDVDDARRFPLAPAATILILDVLQYLDAQEQLDLLARCAPALEPEGKLIFRTQDCRRGFSSRLSAALDRAVFFCGGAKRRPLTLPPEAYRRALEQSRLTLREIRFRNRLGLAHLLFVARKGPRP